MQIGSQMKVDEIFKTCEQPISFEMFPPKGELSMETARKVCADFSGLGPDFISVTCSAGGSGNSGKTTEIAAMIRGDFSVPSVAHLTCQGLTAQGLVEKTREMREAGIENVLALRGDIVPGIEPGDFEYAKDIIPLLADAGFCVGAAAYPEGHIDCIDFGESIMHLKQKQDAGASFFVTQLCFENEIFYRFREAAADKGITVPITCGIMPFLSKAQVSRMIFMCGASLPSPIIKLLAKFEDDPASLRKAGIEYACRQLEGLKENGVDGLHVYTMNSHDIASAAMDALR